MNYENTAIKVMVIRNVIITFFYLKNERSTSLVSLLVDNTI